MSQSIGVFSQNIFLEEHRENAPVPLHPPDKREDIVIPKEEGQPTDDPEIRIVPDLPGTPTPGNPTIDYPPKRKPNVVH